MPAVTPRILFPLTVSLFLGLSACSGAPGAGPGPATPSEGPRPEPRYSYIRTNDLRAAPQLLSGWYQVEEGSWRWMARRSEAVLAAPKRSPSKFEVELALPNGHLALTGPVKLTVLFNHQWFAEQTYAAEGPGALGRTVPPGLLVSGPLLVTLEVNKARPPGVGGDQRELGAIVLGLGFKEN